MEFKEKMFIRTKDGIIDIVANDYNGTCNDPNCNLKHVKCMKGYYDEEDIVKASFNVIDLIEVWDYVNGYEITSIGAPCIANCGKRLLYAKNEKGDIIKMFDENDIDVVLTKEQVKKMEFYVKQTSNDTK